MISIRRVDPREADALTNIALAAKRHWKYPDHWIEIWTSQLTFTPEYFQQNDGWVAVDGDRPIAFYTLLEANDTASIENLWVMPEYMGRGVGRQLFIHAVENARRRGYKTLQLEADPNAVGFYEKMGMRRTGERHTEVDGLPRILPIMEMKV